MNNQDKEIELKKIEIEIKKIELEKISLKESLFKTLVFVLLTVGAGIGALIFKFPIDKKLYIVLLIVLASIFTLILVFVLYLWFSIRKSIKELEKWLKQ